MPEEASSTRDQTRRLKRLKRRLYELKSLLEGEFGKDPARARPLQEVSAALVTAGTAGADRADVCEAAVLVGGVGAAGCSGGD